MAGWVNFPESQASYSKRSDITKTTDPATSHGHNQGGGIIPTVPSCLKRTLPSILPISSMEKPEPMREALERLGNVLGM